MSKRVLLSDQQGNEKDTGEVIDHLIHEMENQLQVISMEAHLRRKPQCVLDAAESIGKLLEEVKQHFLVSR
jgi:hypothetical protein